MKTNGGPEQNRKESPGEMPTVSRPEERAAAEQRRKSFPYRFPRDRRQLGGQFSVQESGRRLLRFFYFERRLAQALGAWTLSIPEFEMIRCWCTSRTSFAPTNEPTCAKASTF